MGGREVDVRLYRFWVRVFLLLSIAFVVFGLFELLPVDRPQPGPNETAPPQLVPTRVAEDRPGLRLGLGVASLALGLLLLVAPQFLKIRPDPAAERLLVFLTKKDCALCDEARVLLRGLLDGTDFTVQELDIDEHRYLRRRFKNDIPVILWQGEVLAKLRIDPQALGARLKDIKERPART